MRILFDPLGAQVQVQQATGDRLTTWLGSLAKRGHECVIGNLAPLQAQLAGTRVYVSLTRQQAGPLSAGVCFGYTPDDLYTLQRWVKDGGSILMFTNHGGFPDGAAGKAPEWPLFEIQLAASLGIQLVFASFGPTTRSPEVPNPCRRVATRTLRMTPSPAAPPALVRGVSTVEAWDSGGIVTGDGTAVIPLPGADACDDRSGLGYSPAGCSFAALYTFGAGRVIVVGHSGIAANAGTCRPSAGQIEAADNLAFLDNCVDFLAG